MRNIILLTISWCSFTLATTIHAQTVDSKKTAKKANQVFQLAKEGYNDLNPKLLVKAAKILMAYPAIGRFQDTLAIDAYDPSDEEAILERYDFFDPRKLLANAKKITPYDDKRLRKKITNLENNMETYIAMGRKYSDIKVKNYLVYGNNSKTITTKFDKNKKVTLSVRIGDELKLIVFDGKKHIGKKRYIGGARLVSFVSKSNGDYFITIENSANKANDCFLMIETK